MTRDPLDQLRSADPVPQPVAYPEDEVGRRVFEILENDGQLPASIAGRAGGRGSRSHWLPAGLAAAAVLVLAVVSAVVFTRGGGNHDAAGAAPVTCGVSVDGGPKAVAARLQQAETAVGERVRASGGRAHDFVKDPDAGTLGFTPHGISLHTAAQACRSSTLAIRPVIAPLVTANTRTPRTSNPLATLRFTVPSDDAAYARLTAAQRSALAAAMSHYNCAPVTSVSTRFALSCSTVPGVQQVLLLGAAVLTGPEVRSASAAEPSRGAGGSSVEWTVQLGLRAAGARRFHAFTAAHHTSSTSATLSKCGSAGAVPCSDFLAFLANGRVLSVPLTNAVLDSEVSISGGFTESAAQTLAGELTAAAVQLHPR